MTELTSRLDRARRIGATAAEHAYAERNSPNWMNADHHFTWYLAHVVRTSDKAGLMMYTDCALSEFIKTYHQYMQHGLEG